MGVYIFLFCIAEILLLLIIAVSSEIQEELVFRIPYPSGIMVDKIEWEGEIYRIGRLQQNAIGLRPAWQGIFLTEGILSIKICQKIIGDAEKFAILHGWSKGRHIDYDIRPTKDLPIKFLYENNTESFETLYHRLESTLLNRIIKQYKLSGSQLVINDLFITKYETISQNFLAAHKDKSPWSFVIPLNEDFEGGGTYFFDSQDMWRPPTGAGLIFRCTHFFAFDRQFHY